MRIRRIFRTLALAASVVSLASCGGGDNQHVSQLQQVDIALLQVEGKEQADKAALAQAVAAGASPATIAQLQANIAADQGNTLFLDLLAQHYNVAAGDALLSETLPAILNSPTWNDPTQKSAIFITFDEDFNNLSLGTGNEGNNVVFVGIPNSAPH